MTLRLGDEAPNFRAETTEEKLTFISGSAPDGGSFFTPRRLHARLHN